MFLDITHGIYFSTLKYHKNHINKYDNHSAIHQNTMLLPSDTITIHAHFSVGTYHINLIINKASFAFTHKTESVSSVWSETYH